MQTIRAIRDDGTIEEINPVHMARVWEEGEFTAERGDEFFSGTHKYTHVMFSCGLVVKYKGFFEKS